MDLEELKEEARNRVQEIENEIRIKLTPDEYLSYLIESNKTGIFSELIDIIKSNSININDKVQEKIAYNNLLNVISKKENCPFCNSKDTIPYYYGVLYPDMIDGTIKIDINYLYGGMENSENNYHCNKCNSNFK